MNRALLCSAAAVLVCAGCASVEMEEGLGEDLQTIVGQLEVVVDNNTDWPVMVRIASIRIGEARPNGTTTLTAPREQIAGRRVSVCVDPIGDSRRRCYSGPFVVPSQVREIRITVPRVGQIRVSAL
jgi:hypothetical protein